jgi:membrane-bound lytic murein transglycosylase D
VQINLDHASRYLFYILQEVAERNMPAEVALIPFLESGFNPKSKNGLHPAGLWGLMPIAGKSLNVSANFFRTIGVIFCFRRRPRSIYCSHCTPSSVTGA